MIPSPVSPRVKYQAGTVEVSRRCSLFLSAGLAAVATLAMTGHVNAQSDDGLLLLKKGDVYEAKLHTSEALQCYLTALKQNPENVDLLVRAARQYRHLMADASTKKEKQRLGNTALLYSQRAAELGPNDSDAQLAIAITHGKMLPLQDRKEQSCHSLIIKQSAEKAIRLNPSNDLAWHILGRWHQVIADLGTMKRALASIFYEELPPASNEDAVRCFEKAIALKPDRLIHYIELGRTYAQMKRPDEARRYLQKGLAMPSVEKDDSEMKQKGSAILAQLP